MIHPPAHRRSLRASRRLVVLGVALVALIGLTSGCGTTKDSGTGVATLDTTSKDKKGDKDSGDGKKKEATDEERQDAMLEFAACMRDHGVDMPDPEMNGEGAVSIAVGSASPASAGSGPDSAEMKELDEASEACDHIMEDVMGEPEAMSPEEQAKFRDEQLAYAKCMREHGVDMPDPQIDFEGGTTAINMTGGADDGPGVDLDSDAFQKATEACESLLGEGRIAVAGAAPVGGMSTGPAFTEIGGGE